MTTDFTPPQDPLQYAKAYAKRGWHVLKLQTNSKAPATLNGVHSATTDEQTLNQWFGSGHVGMGIAAGAVSGIIVIDIDPRNGGHETWATLCAKHEYTPDTLVQKTGGGGWHLVYRYPAQGARSCIIGEGIDVISDGKYFVAEPSAVNAGYFFEDWDVCNDIDVDPAPLPSWLLEAVRPERPAIINGVMRQGKTVTVLEVDDATRKSLHDALQVIDPDSYLIWVRAGLALKCLGDVGKSLWMEYSARSLKFQQQQAEMKWRSFAPFEISFETIFFEAKKLGWSSLPVVPIESIKPVEQTVARVIKHECDLLTIPGALGKVVDWYNLTSPVGQPMFAVQTALAFGSVVCGRRFKTISDSFSSLYFLNVAESGTGKEHCKKALEDLLDACGMSEHLGPSRFSSDTAVHDALFIQPRQVVVIDELAHILNQSKGRSGGLVATSIRQLMEVWGRCHGKLSPPAFSHTGRTGKEVTEQQSRVVYNPALSFVAMSTIESFFKAIGSDGVENGFLNRFLLCVSDVEPQGVFRQMMAKRHLNKEVPQEVSQWVAGIDQWYLSAVGEVAGVQAAGLKSATVVLDYADDGLELMERFDGTENVLSRLELKKDGMAEMFNRRAEMAAKIALIVSMSLGERQISKESVTWAINYVKRHSENAIHAIKGNIHDSAFEGITQQVYQCLIKAGMLGMTRREIAKASRRFRSLDLQGQDRVLEWVANLMGVVATERVGTNGKKTLVYVAAALGDE